VALFSRSFSAVRYNKLLLILLFCVVSCGRGIDVRNLFVRGSSAGKRRARSFVINFQFLSVISRKLQPTTTTTTSEIRAPSFFNFSALCSEFPPFSSLDSCLFPPPPPRSTVSRRWPDVNTSHHRYCSGRVQRSAIRRARAPSTRD